MSFIIGQLNHYTPNKKEEAVANEKVKQIVESAGAGITEVACYDVMYGEHWFSGKDEKGNKVYITWNYFNHNIYVKYTGYPHQ